jgi:hypothetical protein
MEPQNQKCMILADMLSHISQLHGLEEMPVGQLGTTIYGCDLKDLEGTKKVSINKFTIDNALQSILVL